jgi:hypothetical protein
MLQLRNFATASRKAVTPRWPANFNDAVNRSVGSYAQKRDLQNRTERQLCSDPAVKGHPLFTKQEFSWLNESLSVSIYPAMARLRS